MSAINGFGANFSVKQTTASKPSKPSDSGQPATPKFDHNRVWSSLGDSTNALWKYGDEWQAAYSAAFSQGENGGKVSVEDLRAQLQSEFAGYGVEFVDSGGGEPEPVAGRHTFHIDDTNLRKMADDPEYRAQVFGTLQMELVATKGIKFKDSGGEIVSTRLTGTAGSIADMNGKSRGDMPFWGGATAETTRTRSSGSTTQRATGKSVMDIIKEMQKKRVEERREKKLEQEKLETARAERKERAERAEEKAHAEAKTRVEAAEEEELPGVPADAVHPPVDFIA
jgi:hypothetical protein